MKRQAHILLIDDDSTTRELIATVLADANYRVSSLADGRNALDAVRRDPPDLIIADWLMPGFSGLEFARAYRAGTPNPAPVVILTGASNSREAELDPAVAAVMHKPFDLNQLLYTLLRCIKNNASSPPNKP